MEERYHATTQNRFYPDMSNVNKNITVEAKLISPPTILYYIILYYIILYYITLHYITLHYNKVFPYVTTLSALAPRYRIVNVSKLNLNFGQLCFDAPWTNSEIAICLFVCSFVCLFVCLFEVRAIRPLCVQFVILYELPDDHRTV
jgi:hypothetical protein